MWAAKMEDRREIVVVSRNILAVMSLKGKISLLFQQQHAEGGLAEVKEKVRISPHSLPDLF